MDERPLSVKLAESVKQSEAPFLRYLRVVGSGGGSDGVGGVRSSRLFRSIKETAAFDSLVNDSAPSSLFASVDEEASQQSVAAAPAAKVRLPSFDEWFEWLHTDGQAISAKLNRHLKQIYQVASAKKRCATEELVSTLRDVMSTIDDDIRAHPSWRSAEEVVLGELGEHVEKYILSLLHDQFFGNSEEDRLRDQAIHRRLSTLQFLHWDHLDVPEKYQNEFNLQLSQNELLKMNSSKTPAAKLSSISRSCKVIMRMLSSSRAKADAPPGADDFFPVLVMVILRSNVPRLHSNLQFISECRHPCRMFSESAYCYTNVVAALYFLENIAENCESLNMDKASFMAQLAAAEKEFDSKHEAVAPKLSMETLVDQPAAPDGARAFVSGFSSDALFVGVESVPPTLPPLDDSLFSGFSLLASEFTASANLASLPSAAAASADISSMRDGLSIGQHSNDVLGIGCKSESAQTSDGTKEFASLLEATAAVGDSAVVTTSHNAQMSNGAAEKLLFDEQFVSSLTSDTDIETEIGILSQSCAPRTRPWARTLSNDDDDDDDDPAIFGTSSSFFRAA